MTQTGCFSQVIHRCWFQHCSFYFTKMKFFTSQNFSTGSLLCGGVPWWITLLFAKPQCRGKFLEIGDKSKNRRATFGRQPNDVSSSQKSPSSIKGQTEAFFVSYKATEPGLVLFFTLKLFVFFVLYLVVYFPIRSIIPSVYWCCWLGVLTCKTKGKENPYRKPVSEMTYNVFGGTLNPAHPSPFSFYSHTDTQTDRQSHSRVE